jgi:ABC-2 type transport system permease protein
MSPILQYIALVSPLSYIVDAVMSLAITGDLTFLPIDIAAILIFDFVVYVLSSISFGKIIQ